jgi:hypothetical protein
VGSGSLGQAVLIEDAGRAQPNARFARALVERLPGCRDALQRAVSASVNAAFLANWLSQCDRATGAPQCLTGTQPPARETAQKPRHEALEYEL